MSTSINQSVSFHLPSILHESPAAVGEMEGRRTSSRNQLGWLGDGNAIKNGHQLLLRAEIRREFGGDEGSKSQRTALQQASHCAGGGELHRRPASSRLFFK